MKKQIAAEIRTKNKEVHFNIFDIHDVIFYTETPEKDRISPRVLNFKQ